MSRHNEQSHGKDHHHEHQAPRKGIHRDWRFWAAIVMLVAMGIYVATMDEAIGPGGEVNQEVPADAE
jgi:hypothetical protein